MSLIEDQVIHEVRELILNDICAYIAGFYDERGYSDIFNFLVQYPDELLFPLLVKMEEVSYERILQEFEQGRFSIQIILDDERNIDPICNFVCETKLGIVFHDTIIKPLLTKNGFSALNYIECC